MISLCNITKKYGEKTVYDNFSINIESGKITAILGESGSGKTTLLNIIAGLTDFTGKVSGEIKPLSFVFQTDRLVPNLTVAENLRLIVPQVDVLSSLKSVGLAENANDYPKTLSAGMARRVAILRAFLFPSETLLMDEPFINLDPALKFSLINNVCDMQKNSGKTVIAVTHDVKEAVTMASRVIVISEGKAVYDNINVKEKDEKEIFDLMLKIGNKN